MVVPVLFVLGFTPVHGKSMAALWLTMPETITPCINTAERKAMIEASNMQPNHCINNALDGRSSIDTLTSDYLHATLSASATVELRRLSNLDGDSVVCLVTTWGGEAGESQVLFYTQSWQPLPTAHYMPDYTQKDSLHVFLDENKIMTNEKRDSLLALVDPVMFRASLNPSNDSVTLTLSTPLLPSSDRKNLMPFLRQATLKWNGRQFKIGGKL